MEFSQKALYFSSILILCVYWCESAKINTPRVLLPWIENVYVNFTFEIHEGGCYTWSLSRDDIIDLEPIYEDTWGHCSRAARVSVSKACVPPGSVIILIEDVNSGEILRGDVDVAKISSLKVMSTTWKLYLEEAPEAFEVIAYDDQGNKFSTLEGVIFEWTIENLGNNVGEDPLLMFVHWRDTDYEAPRGIAELESQGHRSHSVLLYGQAMGESQVTVCLQEICAKFNLKVVASVVLTPATAHIAPGDTLRYKVVRARAGRLTIQDIAETLYAIKVPENLVARLDDTVSLIRGIDIGTTNVFLMSGITEVATATLTVAEPYSIRVSLRPPHLLIRGDMFIIHCALLDAEGHPLTAGDEILIRLSVEGNANVDLITSTENGTLTDAVAQDSGEFTVTARLYSIGGRSLKTKVEGQVSGVVVDPLQVLPPDLFVAWTDSIQEISLKHRGGGDESVVWSESEPTQNGFSLTPTGVITIRDVGEVGVKVQLKKYPHVFAVGRVWSAVPEMIQLSSTGHARVNKPHHLHIALTATHPDTGELYNFHTCDCESFAISLLEGPEPQNVTVTPWIQPIEGACCVIETVWQARGVSTVRASRGRAGDTARVAVRAAPALVWPENVAALVTATLPVLAEGEALVPLSGEPRVAELGARDGSPPHRHPDIKLFTVKCRRKGDSRLELSSDTEGEKESVEFNAACAPHVSKIRLEPPETPGNCSGGPRIWLRPNQEVKLKVTLLDAIGRELLDERGPKMYWEIEPKHPGIQYTATDRLFIETHPEYAPVPVPYTYYQMVIADEQAIGWYGALKANIPEATASIQARVVAPLTCDPLKVNIAWEGESVTNIATVSGGSGRYSVDTPKGVTATVDDGVLNAIVPGPGSYDMLITDLCVQGERQYIEVHIEEVLNVEVSTSRAVCVGSCVPITALVKGVSHRYLSTGHAPDFRVAGQVEVRGGALCGLQEGSGRVRASFGGVWSPEVDVLVFPPLSIVPSTARVPPGARLQLRSHGGPPPHLATLHYQAVSGSNYVEVTSSGAVHGLSIGRARIKLVARDIANVETASAESEVDVIPISGVRVRAATQTLLVGAPGPLWVEAGGLSAGALAALQPPPRVTWTLRDASTARLYTTHTDDLLERSIAEGLSVRVVPLKPGVITIDVRVRNMGQVAETRSLDSTIEILGISDIRTAVEGLPNDLSSGARLALAVGATVHVKSLPRSNWKAYEDGAFELTSNGEIRALSPGYGVIVAQHKDERNNIYRETAIHVEVAVPHYCTVEPSGDGDENTVRLAMRSAVGRVLLSPHANVSAVAPLVAHPRRAADSVHGTELVITGLETAGAFLSFQGTASGVTVRDEVWVTGTDLLTNRVYVTGGWAVCLEGVGWRAPNDVTIYEGRGVSLAVMSRDTSGKHALQLDRNNVYTVHQIPVDKIEFVPGEWPYSKVPLTIVSSGLSDGPLICTEDQRYALEGVDVKLPYTCRTKKPHTAEPVLDVINGKLGCSIIPAAPIREPSEIELCAEWGISRSCTKTFLLPPIHVAQTKVSLLNPPTTITIHGHPQALRMVKITPSPGLKIEPHHKDSEITVIVRSETVVCGVGWINIKSSLTSQELRVEVERECDVSCGTLLGAMWSLLKPNLANLMMIVAMIIAYIYVYSRWSQKSPVRIPVEPMQLPVPPTPSPLRLRTWSRSPYASNGPVYGDTSVLPDSSISPNGTRIHSRFL